MPRSSVLLSDVSQISGKNRNEATRSDSCRDTATEQPELSKLTTDDRTQKNNPHMENGEVSKTMSNAELHIPPMNTELTGFICVHEYRHLSTVSQQATFLVCRRFWDQGPILVSVDENNHIHYHEKFVITNHNKFLENVKMKYLHLELWQHSLPDEEDTKPLISRMKPLGVALLPMYQFYIAYRDKVMIDRLRNGKLPVISINDWAVVNAYTKETSTTIGQLKCLFAVGTEKQIACMLSKEFMVDMVSKPIKSSPYDILEQLVPLKIPKQSNNLVNNLKMILPQSCNASLIQKKGNRNQSSFQNVIPSQIKNKKSECKNTELSQSNSDYSNSVDNLVKSNQFTLTIEIIEAKNLPVNPSIKIKRAGRRCHLAKRNPPNELPSCYVTFEAENYPASYCTYNSFGNKTFATRVIEKSTNPKWNERFHLSLPADYLTNKPFILKVWKKSSVNIPYTRTESISADKILIGLVSFYLFPLVNGQKEIFDYYPIMDFGGKNKGQLQCRSYLFRTENDVSKTAAVDAVIEQFSQTLDIAKLNLGDVIEHKFKELEAINERLKKRLADVAGEPLSQEKFNFQLSKKWQPLNFEEDDEDNKELDDFEYYINTTLPETIAEEENNAKLE